MERTAKPIEQVFETYRFSGTRSRGEAMEGHVMLTLDPKLVKEKDHDSGRVLLGAR